MFGKFQRNVDINIVNVDIFQSADMSWNLQLDMMHLSLNIDAPIVGNEHRKHMQITMRNKRYHNMGNN